MATVCSERGYAETSLEEVLEQAGASASAFSENFADKEECALAAIGLILAESTAAASVAYSPETADRDGVLRGIRAMLELWAARPSFADMGYIQSRQTMPRAGYEVYAAGVKMMASMVDRMRECAVEDVRVPPTTARGVLGGIEALIRREIVAGRAEELPQLLPDIAYMAMVPFLGQEEALHYASRGRELLNDGG